MKLRALSALEDAISQETAWRRRELTTLLFNVRASRDSTIQVPLRAGVAMLYAHWEGWVKALARLYIAYVDQQKLRYDDLNEAFLGIALRTRLEMIGEAKAAATHNDFASFVIGGGLASPAPLSLSVVRTEGNLSSAVMRDIVTRLGVPYQPYELFAALIDERLVRARNTIAHGDHLEVTVSSYEDLHARVIRMLNAYTIDVLNAAATQAYRRPVLPATSPAP